MFTSIAAHGEWSMGKVLDIYFQFSAGADCYLGQLLSLKDPNSVEFDTPYLHWHNQNDPVVMEALELTFGQILMEHGNTSHDPQGVLSLCLLAWLITLTECLVFLKKTQVILLVKSPFSQAPSYRK